MAETPEEEWERTVRRPLQIADIWLLTMHSKYPKPPIAIQVPKGVVILEAANAGNFCLVSVPKQLKEYLRPENRAEFAELIATGARANKRDAEFLEQFHVYKEGDIMFMRQFNLSLGRGERVGKRRMSSRILKQMYSLGLFKYPSTVYPSDSDTTTKAGFVPHDKLSRGMRMIDSQLTKGHSITGKNLIENVLTYDTSLKRVYDKPSEERLAVFIFAGCAVYQKGYDKKAARTIIASQREVDLAWARFNPYGPAGSGWGEAAPGISVGAAAAATEAMEAILPEDVRKKLEKKGTKTQEPVKFHISAYPTLTTQRVQSSEPFYKSEPRISSFDPFAGNKGTDAPFKKSIVQKWPGPGQLFAYTWVIDPATGRRIQQTMDITQNGKVVGITPYLTMQEAGMLALRYPKYQIVLEDLSKEPDDPARYQLVYVKTPEQQAAEQAAAAAAAAANAEELEEGAAILSGFSTVTSAPPDSSGPLMEEGGGGMRRTRKLKRSRRCRSKRCRSRARDVA